MLQEKRIAVVGLGLMGGSMAGALRMRQVCQEVIGIAHRPETAAQALERGLVDRATTDLAAGVSNADIVILATPVRTIIKLLHEIGRLVGPGCLIMDLGSTKTAIIQAMSALPDHVQPVGGHPMCGKETAGLEAAETTLYQDKLFLLVPGRQTGPRAMELACSLVQAIGAHPLILTPEEHDRLVAAVSHLPYLLAVALVATAEDLSVEDGRVWEIAASGFRDTSRLAASGVRMMLDILLTNRDAVQEMVKRAQNHLSRLAGLMAQGDEETLCRVLDAVQQRRKELFR